MDETKNASQLKSLGLNVLLTIPTYWRNFSCNLLHQPVMKRKLVFLFKTELNISLEWWNTHRWFATITHSSKASPPSQLEMFGMLLLISLLYGLFYGHWPNHAAWYSVWPVLVCGHWENDNPQIIMTKDQQNMEDKIDVTTFKHVIPRWLNKPILAAASKAYVDKLCQGTSQAPKPWLLQTNLLDLHAPEIPAWLTSLLILQMSPLFQWHQNKPTTTPASITKSQTQMPLASSITNPQPLPTMLNQLPLYQDWNKANETFWNAAYTDGSKNQHPG